MNLIPGIAASASALNAERIRMEVVTQNIANANTTRDINGKPYQRQNVVFETMLLGAQDNATGGAAPQGIQVARVEKDTSESTPVYDPTHPDADAGGYVTYPNVKIQNEMVDLIASSRAFEANLAVVKNARQMALESLSIAKH
jgi:flagellar basal-body rod protein FlgC